VNETLEIPITNQNVARLDLIASEALRSLPQASLANENTLPEIVFQGASGQDFLGAGLSNLHSVVVKGHAGKLAFCGMDDCECTLDGNAGDFFGHSLASGLLICKGSVANGAGAMARSGLIAVYGSAGDRTACSAPMLAPPPGRLSITTACFQSFDSRAPSVRAMMSVVPPAGKGITMRTGLDG